MPRCGPNRQTGIGGVGNRTSQPAGSVESIYAYPAASNPQAAITPAGGWKDASLNMRMHGSK